jgi:hypothetical protein
VLGSAGVMKGLAAIPAEAMPMLSPLVRASFANPAPGMTSALANLGSRITPPLVQRCASALNRLAQTRVPNPLARLFGTAPNATAEIAKSLVKEFKGSSRAAAEALNKRGLPQVQVAEIMAEVYRQSGRDIAGVQTLADGTKVLLSRRVGDAQPIVAISKEGKAIFGTADLKMTTTPPFFEASNLRLPQ